MKRIELVKSDYAPPPPGASRPQFDGLPDYQRHAGSSWDFGAATQFTLMYFLGLRQEHYLLDIGCGSLRAGRLLATYLLPGHYYGIEPIQWTIDVVLAEELGREFVAMRRPVISNDDGFNLTAFGRRFDFMLAHSVFTHATQGQVRKCLAEAREALEPHGVLAATYGAGDTDYAGGQWAWPNCILYRPATMLAFIEQAGLTARHMDWPLFDPQGAHKLLLIARPENEDFLARCLQAREEGRVTLWKI